METGTPKRDVIIIGGGPAGLSTALHLAQQAPELIPRILVLEKEHYPRPKLCAGGLVADAEILLRRLDLDAGELPHVDVHTVHMDFTGKGLTLSLPETHTLRIIRRDEFDAWLAAKARARGIEIHEGCMAKTVTVSSSQVIVETEAETYQAQVLIGADGSNGIVRRTILPNARISTARVLEVLTPAYAEPDRAGKAYFDFFPVPDGVAGYTWDFPTQIKSRPMRCWGIYDANILTNPARLPLKEPLAKEMARFGLKLDDYELKGHPIRWFDPFHAFSVPRVLLVGDAAGADPFFGEGISMALAYGRLAAAEVTEAFREDDFRLSRYKRRVLWHPLGQTLLARWLLTWVIYPLRWKWFQFFLWRIFKPVVMLIAWFFVLNWAKRMK